LKVFSTFLRSLSGQNVNIFWEGLSDYGPPTRRNFRSIKIATSIRSSKIRLQPAILVPIHLKLPFNRSEIHLAATNDKGKWRPAESESDPNIVLDSGAISYLTVYRNESSADLVMFRWEAMAVRVNATSKLFLRILVPKGSSFTSKQYHLLNAVTEEATKKARNNI
jgi:hypothetical protein